MRFRRRNGRTDESRKNERGTELVEITLVLPLLIFLVMGMLDAGVAWKTKLEVVQATRQGARIGSAFGNDPLADQEALLAAMSVIPEYVNVDPNSTTPRLEYIVLYRADAANGEPTNGCKTGPSVDNLCLRLSRAQVETFLAAYAADPLSNHLAAMDRWEVRPDDPELLESLGVYIQATQPSFTGIFESIQTWDIKGKTVMRTEPLIE